MSDSGQLLTSQRSMELVRYVPEAEAAAAGSTFFVIARALEPSSFLYQEQATAV
jgi:hypothetical protein